MATTTETDAVPEDRPALRAPAFSRIARWLSRRCQTSRYIDLADGIQRRLLVVLIGKASNVMMVALAAFAVCATCYERHGPPAIPVVSGINLILLVARSHLVIAFRARQADGERDAIDLWLSAFAVLAVASSICWGAGTALSLALSHDPVLYVLSLVCTVATAGAIAARNSAFPRVAIVQLAVSLVPTMLGCLFADDQAYAIMSILTVGLMYGLMLVVSDSHKQLVDLFVTQDMLHRLTYTDQLTSTYNRRFFFDLVRERFSGSQDAPCSIGIMMIDVDFFKRFNDRYGHPEGDRCLRDVATILARHLTPDGGTLCRYGGEEFVVLVEGVDGEEMMRRAELLRSAVHAAALSHDDRGDGIGVVTVSIGGAWTSDRSSGPEAVIAAADTGLYEAKRLGRNRACLAA